MAYKKVFYTRRYQAPPPVVGQHKFFALLKKRKLEEIRVALESGEFEQQHDSNCIDTDDEESNASTSCTASPRSSRAGGAEAGTGLELSSRREQQEAQAAAERASETARRKAEDDLLNTIHAKLQERQAAAAAEKLAEKHELEEQHAAASQQIREVQQRLEQLREAKHDLVKQLKQAMQAEQAVKQQQLALQQQQQMQQLMQQQQDLWQQQQMQQQQQAAVKGPPALGIPSDTPRQLTHISVTPRSDSLISPAAYTPGYAGTPTPGGGARAPGSNAAGYTPRVGLSPAGAARSQWLFSTPAQPPPPPPRQQQHQQPLSEFQKQQHIADPAIAGTHGPLHGSVSVSLGGQQQQYQQQNHGLSGTASWGRPPARPIEHQVQQHIGPMPGNLPVHEMHNSSWQDRGHSSMETATAAASPRRSYSGIAGQGPTSGLRSPGSKKHRIRDSPYHHNPAPDSPEEGEALPSPQPLHLRAFSAPGAATSGAARHDSGHGADRDRSEAAYGSAAAGSSGVARQSDSDGDLLRTLSGGGSIGADRHGLLRTYSAGGGSSTHLLSPPSSGGSIRGGVGGLSQFQSAAVDSRSLLSDRVAVVSRDRDNGSLSRPQQEHHGSRSVGGAAEAASQQSYGKRRRNVEGGQQLRRSGGGPDAARERGAFGQRHRG